MTRTRYMLITAAAVALAGCGMEDHNIVAGGPGDDQPGNGLANANVQLPPSIVASRIYRCADNVVVYVEWMSDHKSANIRTEQAGSPTRVTTAEAGQPMAGPADYSLEGTATAATAKIGVPGHPAQTCKA